jgi:pyruvate dehydrogenase E2 component (dihydrolipoamide acetyltransferase)
MTRMAIRMPKMSMTMTEGEVSEWMVEVGDAVAEGDVVCEVMTDKVDMEVESTVSGTLVEIAVAAGMANVGDPIGWVEGEDTGGGFGDLLSEPDLATAPAAPDVDAAPDIPDAPSGAEAPTTTLPVEPSAAAPAPPAAPVTPAGPVAAVPRARGLATELGIDLGRVTGTGPDGLVLVRDVEALAPAAPTPAPTPTVVSPPAPPAPPAPIPTAAPAASTRQAPTDRRTAIRKAVARAMMPSAAIPQFTVWREIRLDAADAGRNGLSWTTLLLRAYAGALREVPDLLSRWEGDAPTPAGPPSIALAVATDRGLLVPTFAEPDLEPVEDVDRKVREVVQAARAGKLDSAYLGVANGSLSNLGGLGVDRFQALLTPPQASVLSLGSIRRRPVAVAGGVGTALTLEAGLTVDHRVADGAHAAELLDRFARRLGAVP